jgi:rhodanese-related sulfurtransferase
VKKLLALVLLVGCHHDGAPAPQRITVEQAAALIDAHAATAVDVNVDDVRARQGVVPGAVLLSDYAGFAWSELPSDRAIELVFYCANEQCGASELAAQRAAEHGYQKVAVMEAGIAGWRQSGRTTQKL